ncbi:MAG: HAD family phosphatase [Sulfolobaceae archaeon]|jgi:HAD superfamily hydrolase (TIGR01509 family)
MKAAIFDLDGTLANTEEIHKKAWEIALNKLGYNINVDINYLLGRKTIDIAKILVGEDNAEKLASLKTQIYSELIKVLAKPKSCANEIVTYLKRKGIYVAVVTSSMKISATQVLKIIGIEPDVLISGDDVSRGKPDPMPVLEALRRLGVKANDSIGVGDTLYDVIAYHNAGIPKIFLVRSSIPINQEELRKYNVKLLSTLCDLML